MPSKQRETEAEAGAAAAATAAALMDKCIHYAYAALSLASYRAGTWAWEWCAGNTKLSTRYVSHINKHYEFLTSRIFRRSVLTIHLHSGHTP